MSSEIAISASELTRTFGGFTAVDHISLEVTTGRDLRIPGCQRRREDDRDAHVHRPAGAQQRYRPGGGA